jgi:hypothetical protein
MIYDRYNKSKKKLRCSAGISRRRLEEENRLLRERLEREKRNRPSEHPESYGNWE